MSWPVIHRLVYEQRVRLLLELLFTAAWGFLLVALFATSDTFNQMLQQQAQMLGPIYNLLDLDPLAQWASIGLQHPLFFVGGGLFAIGMGIRAIAGELQDGSLALSITRPISRLRWFASQLAVIVPGSILLGAMYGVGCILAATVTTHQGTLHPAWMLLAGAEGGLVLLTFGALALLFSAFSADRGRATAWSLGTLVAMYALSYLLPLWSGLEDIAKVTPFGWFRPGDLIQHGTIPWTDVAVLVLYAAVPSAIAAWRFATRDLAG